jgi:hypothetical protein
MTSYTTRARASRGFADVIATEADGTERVALEGATWDACWSYIERAQATYHVLGPSGAAVYHHPRLRCWRCEEPGA